MRTHFVPHEWMLRCIADFYGFSGVNAMFEACHRASMNEGRLLTPTQVRNQFASYKAGESELPDYVEKHFYRLFPRSQDAREKSHERATILAAE